MSVNGETFLNASSMLKNSSSVINESVKNIVRDIKKYITINSDLSDTVSDISNISNSCDKIMKVSECYSVMGDIANGIGAVYDSVEV